MRYVVRHLRAASDSVLEEAMEAASEDELRARLIKAGSVVLELRAQGGSAGTMALHGDRFNIAWWCHELRALLRAGMTAVEAIETLAAGRHDAARDKVHAALQSALHEGLSLSRAMHRVGAFPAVLVASVTASERTSTLVDALDDYLRYHDMLDRLRRQAVSAAIYPALVTGLGAAISTFLLIFVIPRFSRMYGDLHGATSTATSAVLWLSRALREHMPLVLAALVMAFALAALAWRSGALSRTAELLLEQLEPLRRQWDHFRLAKLYQSLALMFKGGYTLDEALQVCQGLELGLRMSTRLAVARSEIAKGKPASAAMTSAELDRHHRATPACRGRAHRQFRRRAPNRCRPARAALHDVRRTRHADRRTAAPARRRTRRRRHRGDDVHADLRHRRRHRGGPVSDRCARSFVPRASSIGPEGAPCSTSCCAVRAPRPTRWRCACRRMQA